jgi:16S rRNA processing protein RimM
MFEKDSCYRLGHIARLHGFKGELSIFLDTDDPSDFKTLESVFVEYDQKLIPFFLEKIQIQQKGFAVVRFEDIDTEKKAKMLVGCSLYMPLETLPELDESEFYFHEATGFDVIDKTHGPIGRVTKVIDLAGNPLLEIDFNGREILIPKQDEFIEKIDRDHKILYVVAPPGLLEMYLNDEEE